MAPKTDASNGNEAFLITCLKCAKAKPDVDLDAVAKVTGMSRGGAGNKFRALMKQFEDEGAIWTNTSTGNWEKTTPKRKATPRKPATKSDAKVEDDDNDSATEEKPQAKKAKAKPAPKKKGTATLKEKKVAEASASEGEAKDGEETAAASEPEE